MLWSSASCQEETFLVGRLPGKGGLVPTESRRGEHGQDSCPWSQDLSPMYESDVLLVCLCMMYVFQVTTNIAEGPPFFKLGTTVLLAWFGMPGSRETEV